MALACAATLPEVKEGCICTSLDEERELAAASSRRYAVHQFAHEHVAAHMHDRACSHTDMDGGRDQGHHHLQQRL